MKATKLLLLALTGALLATPLSSALADPWRHGDGDGRYERRWERHEERRWRAHERRAERAWRQEQRERRAASERYRAYEQGRADGYQQGAQQNPVAVLGQLLGR
jgi:flagellar biosynthesis/type III secretory pathway protein FliH